MGKQMVRLDPDTLELTPVAGNHNDLKTLQGLVGGLIELVRGDQGIDVWIERIFKITAYPFAAFRTVQAAEIKDELGIFTGDEFDPLKEVITEKDIILPGASGNLEIKPAVIVVRKEVQGRGWYSASLPREGLIVFPGNYLPGWHARVDGRRADVFEANIFSKGVVVPSGRHEIVMRYLPVSFLRGAAVSIISLGFSLIGLAVFSIRFKRKARRASL